MENSHQKHVEISISLGEILDGEASNILVTFFTLKTILGGGNSNIFYVHPYLGKWSNLTNIFQMGWFNHQLELGEDNFHFD